MSKMSITSFVSAAQLLPNHISVMVRGDHGIGKSALGRTLSLASKKSMNLSDYEFIDCRLSQFTEGDMLGLPSIVENSTTFNPPVWYKKACTKPCFLLLDELNRATQEVMQAAFQIVLDRELNGFKLHPQTRVMVAVNNSSRYNVNQVDPALLDRFWVVDLEPTVADWVNWAKSLASLDFLSEDQKKIKAKIGGINIMPIMIDFIMNNEKFLDAAKDSEDTQKQSSRRSWERLSDSLVHANLTHDAKNANFYLISVGFVGVEAAIAFQKFAEKADKHITGKDIVEKYASVRDRVKGCENVDVFNDAIEKCSTYLSKLDKVNEAQGNNVSEFVSDLPSELKMSFWTKIANGGTARFPFVNSISPFVTPHILSIFGMEPGSENVGKMPNIPGFLKKEAKLVVKFEFSLKERSLNELRLRKKRIYSPESEKKHKANSKYIRQTGILAKWCKKNGIKMYFDSNEESATFYETGKEIVISTRVSPKYVLYTALHECGHYLIWKSNKSQRFAEGYGLADQRKEKTFLHKCDILDEEFEAWYRGLYLAQRLGIKVDVDDFHKFRANMLKCYVKWAWRTRGKSDNYFELGEGLQHEKYKI